VYFFHRLYVNSKISKLHCKIEKCAISFNIIALCQVLISFLCVVRKNVHINEIDDQGFDTLLSLSSTSLSE